MGAIFSIVVGQQLVTLLITLLIIIFYDGVINYVIIWNQTQHSEDSWPVTVMLENELG